MSDILVVMPPLTADDTVIFAKNAHRPPSEVHEVVYNPAADHPTGSKLHTTFIEVDQVSHTHAVVLSKAAWCWGAEMGANEHGLCVGSTAVWTTLCRPGDHEERLIGQDFVRLALERAKTAREALDVITTMLHAHDQGGPSCEDHNFGQWTYHNSFIMADPGEAWLLETAGKMWAAKKVTSGILTTSSTLTIGTDADLTSENLDANAAATGNWKLEDGPVNFAKAFSSEYPGISLSDSQQSSNRLKCGQTMLLNSSKQGKIELNKMFEIIRDESSSLNFIGELLTVSSQVSVVTSPSSSQPSCHWFTATPNPKMSVFKPFIFCENVSTGNGTVSPAPKEKLRATFQTAVDRRHQLYKSHEKARYLMESGSPAGQQLQTTMEALESQCVREVTEFLRTFKDGDLNEVKDLFSDIAESEIKFYN